MLILVLTSGGGSDSDGGGESSGYTDAMHDDFYDVCSSIAVEEGITDSSTCECGWNEIVQSVPYDVYHAFESAYAGDPSTPILPDVRDAVVGCV